LIKEAQGEVYNIAGRFEVKVSDLVDRITRLVGSKSEIKYVGYRKNEGPETRMSLDIAKAERILGYRPVITFEEGLTTTVEWLSKNLARHSGSSAATLNGQGLR
jgi:dTDP-glucose 4,6-dehydratase